MFGRWTDMFLGSDTGWRTGRPPGRQGWFPGQCPEPLRTVRGAGACQACTARPRSQMGGRRMAERGGCWEHPGAGKEDEGWELDVGCTGQQRACPCFLQPFPGEAPFSLPSPGASDVRALPVRKGWKSGPSGQAHGRFWFWPRGEEQAHPTAATTRKDPAPRRLRRAHRGRQPGSGPLGKHPMNATEAAGAPPLPRSRQAGPSHPPSTECCLLSRGPKH